MKLLIIILLKTKSMKINWKNVILYMVHVIELLLTGAAGGAISGNL